MKIKPVCELTGLTDRTIRYYIEENLISPSYTENYLGRKSYSFSQEDVECLNDIALLRKFDFTVDEIKSILSNSQTSKEILSNVKDRAEKSVLDGQAKLLVLSQISTEKEYTVAELARELSKVSVSLPEHNEKIKGSIWKTALSILKSFLISALVWMPFALSLVVIIYSVNLYRYPVFEFKMIALLIVSFFPSIAVLIISKIKFKWKKIARCILLVLCAISIPVSSILSVGVVFRSETTDITNYRKLDADCVANRSSFFQELFPAWPHYFEYVKQADGSYKDVYLDSKYYYHYFEGFDYTYDIYAEWPLNEEEYIKEVARVADLFNGLQEGYYEIKKGDYNCMILYYGNEPFTEVNASYNYYIFAYNDKTNTVRYIHCSSLENGADQPYYLKLDW